MLLDRSTAFGQRADRRLGSDLICWLTTVRRDGTPLPAPVWFVWDGQTMLVYSQPATQKLRNLAHNARVALNLDGDGKGGDIIVATGTARIDEMAPPADQNEPYLAKYAAAITRIGMTPASFARAYSVAIRVTPERIHGH